MQLHCGIRILSFNPLQSYSTQPSNMELQFNWASMPIHSSDYMSTIGPPSVQHVTCPPGGQQDMSCELQAQDNSCPTFAQRPGSATEPNKWLADDINVGQSRSIYHNCCQLSTFTSCLFLVLILVSFLHNHVLTTYIVHMPNASLRALVCCAESAWVPGPLCYGKWLILPSERYGIGRM